MADQFEAAHERGEANLAFDRWGRYKFPHPETGKVTAFTRSTTFAKSISDTFALSQWSQRMAVKGVALRPDLLAMAHTLDVKEDKDKFNNLCEDAKAAAGNKVAANLGTALHSFSEAVDKGMDVADVPEPHRPDILAYRRAMDDAGIQVVPELVERQTCVPAYEVAGTFDRILDLSTVNKWFLLALLEAGYGTKGTNFLSQEPLVIGDVKSGQDLQYGWNEIAIQLATYAMGARTTGIWNKATQSWEPPAAVRLDFAIVMHMPVGQRTCTLYALDLADAFAAMDLCRAVRRWRKRRNLARPLVRAVAEPEPAGPEHLPTDNLGVEVTGLSWLQRFQLAGSRGELSALFNEAVAAGVWSDTLKDAGTARLKILEEKAG